MNATNDHRTSTSTPKGSASARVSAIACLLIALLGSGCVADVGASDEQDVEEDDVEIGVHTDALSVYGQEIRLDACAWSDHPANITCRQGFGAFSKTPCTFDSQGTPNNASKQYVVTPSDSAARSIKWGPSTVSLDWEAPTVYCSQSSGDGVFYASGANVGSVLVRVPGVYDYILENTVRGTVRYTTLYTPGSWEMGPNFYVAVLQKQNADGTWTDIAKKAAAGFTSGVSQTQTLEVQARVKPNTNVRVELRVGAQEARHAKIMIASARLFSPKCVPNQAKPGTCL